MDEKNRLEQAPRESGISLIPFVIFIGLYLGVGIYLSTQGVEMAFYQFPILLACLIGIAFAFVIHEGTMEDKLGALIKGMGDQDVMVMCLIYILAGAFSSCSDAMGGVESTVNLALTKIPSNLLIAGIFLISSFLSLAMGTSMGTIAAVVPVAVGLASKANLNIYLTVGACLGGAMFGDNLSIISDTTIAATRSQGVEMRDKFRMNLIIALIAAAVTFALLVAFGRPDHPPLVKNHPYNVLKIIPYLFVLIAALAGMNVLVVLMGGIVIAAGIGMLTSSFTFIEATASMGAGMLNMAEIYILSMLVGGLASMCRKDGGFAWLMKKLTKNVKSTAGAQGTIAALVSLVDLAAANNTVAIIITGPLAKDLSTRFKVDPRRSASILDIFSCVFQGLIPYGAQALLALSLTAKTTGLALNPFKVIPNTWYCLILSVVAILSIFIPFADQAIKKDPWNFEQDCKQSQVRHEA